MKKLLSPICLFMIANVGFAQTDALHFDGVNDYVPITGTSKLNSMTRITVETWLYVTNFNSSPCADCAPVIWNQQNSYRFSTGNTQKVNISVLNGSTAASLTSSGTLTANKWHHIAATFNGTKLKIYIDGVNTDSATFSSFNISYSSSSSDVWIVDPVTGYGGILEETRIWDYARSAAQIQEGMIRHYKSTEPGLALQLSYEDGVPYDNNTSVSSVADGSKYSHNGTPTNFTLTDSTSNFVLGRDYCDTTAYAKFSVSQCTRYQLPSKKKFITVSGVYQDTIVSYRGCDSVMTITVKILKPSTANVSLTSCDSVQNPVTKVWYKTSGKYTIYLINSVGCDSAISYFVTIFKKDTTKLSYMGCNSVVLSNGKTVTSSGIYIDSLKSVKGCDSTVIHTVTIRNSSINKVTLRMCKFVISPSDPNVIYRNPGTYYDTLTNKIGCDSVIEYIVVSNVSYGTINAFACGSYKSPSKKYTWNTAGTYYDTLFFGNYLNCDSFITVNLGISSPAQQTLFVTGCQSYTVPSGSKTVTYSDTFYDVIKGKNGCDSIEYTLHVRIINVNTSFIRTGNTLTASTSNTGATFQWLDCNNQYAKINGETNKTFTPTANGNFALEVKENNCTDTSNCQNFVFNSVASLNSGAILLWPNPSNGIFEIQSATPLHDVTVRIISTTGQTLMQWHIASLLTETMHTDLPPGLHLVAIEAKEGRLVKYILFE